MYELYQKSTLAQAKTSGQQGLAFEPHRLYHANSVMGEAQFALCSKHGDGRINQQLFPIHRLDWAVQQVAKVPERQKTNFWISQATLAPWATNRRISSIMLLNAVWVDIDLAHPPKSFDQQNMPQQDTPERLAQLLVAMLEDANLPLPTLIIYTGGGLCPKWIFERPIPAVARARWQSLQREIVKKVGELRWFMGDQCTAWPVDHQACDAARILRLVGTHNPRWGQDCRIVWDGGQQQDFDYLADEVLKYTREEVSAFRAKFKIYEHFDVNREAARAAGIRQHQATGQQSRIADEAARHLWVQRVEFGKAVLTDRDGAYEGSRNNLFWPLANALAWSCSGDQLTHELAALHHAYFRSDGWTRGEAMASAGTVLRKLKTGEPYRMKTTSFLEKLEITTSELNAHGSLLGSSRHNMHRADWNVGTMGFEPMRGLSSDEFIAETKRRQGAAGARSAEIRKSTHSDELHAKAKLMAGGGLSTRQIALEIGVGHMTVARWLKK